MLTRIYLKRGSKAASRGRKQHPPRRPTCKSFISDSASPLQKCRTVRHIRGVRGVQLPTSRVTSACPDPRKSLIDVTRKPAPISALNRPNGSPTLTRGRSTAITRYDRASRDRRDPRRILSPIND